MGIGTIFVLTPAVGWSLPLIWPFVLSAAGALGYQALTSAADDAVLRGELNSQLNSLRIVKLPLERIVKDMVADEVKRDQVMRFQRGDVILIFRRDERGKFFVEVMGPEAKTQIELEHAGLEFASELVQQFAYNKMAQEMERRGAQVVEEEIQENGDIVLRMRRWQ